MSPFRDFSDPRSFFPNNLSGYCIYGEDNDTFFQRDELSPEIWIATDSLVATSFASLAISIMLIGCVISGLVCGVAIHNKALKSWLGVSYVIDLTFAVVLMSIYTPVHLYTIAQGNWTIGGDTDCERQNACIAVASVIMILILNKEIALQCLPLYLNYFIAGESFFKRRIGWFFGIIVILFFFVFKRSDLVFTRGILLQSRSSFLCVVFAIYDCHICFHVLLKIAI